MVAPNAAKPAPRKIAPTNLALLHEQIGEVRQKDDKDYHDGAQVIRWLNHVLLEENWSQRVVDHGRDEESDELWALVEFIGTIYVEDDDHLLQAFTVTKQDFGAQKIERLRSNGLPRSIGDARKAAVTDGLKRCARLLGIGLYLWDKPSEWELPHERDDEAEAQRARQLAGSRPAAAPERPRMAPAAQKTPRPVDGPSRQSSGQADPVAVLQPGQRAALENRYDQLTCEVQELDVQASWVGTHHSKWTDPQLQRYVALLEKFIDQSQHRGAA